MSKGLVRAAQASLDPRLRLTENPSSPPGHHLGKCSLPVSFLQQESSCHLPECLRASRTQMHVHNCKTVRGWGGFEGGEGRGMVLDV